MKKYLGFLIPLILFISCSSKKEAVQINTTLPPLENVLKPTNEYVISNIPTVTLSVANNAEPVTVYGFINYDNTQLSSVSSRAEGRIVKMYVNYRYQYISKGQKILDLYSPELVNSEQNLIYLINNDPDNLSLISAAKQRLLLVGMTRGEVAELVKNKKAFNSVSFYSPNTGYITEVLPGGNLSSSLSITNEQTANLNIKEGAYVQKGQQLFAIVNASRAIVSLDIFPEQQQAVHPGTPVDIYPDAAPDVVIKGKIDYIDPEFKQGSKTISARVYIEKGTLPVGSSVKAMIHTNNYSGSWLPASAVLTTGMQNVVFLKENSGFTAHRVEVGERAGDKVEIKGGLALADSVALNAQQLVSSENTLKIKK